MVCDVCKVEMNDTTTEMEVSVKGRKVKALNIPATVCPKCNKLVVEELAEKLVQKAAKHCKAETFDYPKEVKVLGFGFGFGKAKV